MRVLIFSTAYLPEIGGAELAVKEITDRLPDIQFVMITARLRSDLLEHERIGNVEVYRIGSGNFFDKIRLIFQGPKKAMELGKFDCVWSIMASYGGFAALGYKKRNNNVPFLLTLQEGDSMPHIYARVWWCWPWFKQIFMKADRIQAISTYLADWAKRMGARCSVEIIPNGVDSEKFSIFNFQFSNTSHKDRRPVDVADNARVIITISRLVSKNGIADLIQSMRYLPSDVHLLIAGSGELEAELKQTAENISVHDRVHFVGNVDADEVPSYLAASDVFCRPSISEGLGTAFLEAMAAGMPVIGTPVGGIPDFLKDTGKAGQAATGWFCEVKNPKSIAEKIQYVLDEKNKAEVERVVANARAMVQNQYSWERIAEQMKSVFASLVPSP